MPRCRKKASVQDSALLGRPALSYANNAFGSWLIIGLLSSNSRFLWPEFGIFSSDGLGSDSGKGSLGMARGSGGVSFPW